MNLIGIIIAYGVQRSSTTEIVLPINNIQLPNQYGESKV